MQKKILGILSFSLIITVNSWATRIPAFSGYWYYTADNMNLNAHTNACGENQGYNYEFTHKTTSKHETALSSAHSYFCNYYGQCPTACEIAWEFEKFPELVPNTFPNQNLWELTVAESYNPQLEHTRVDCEIPFYGTQPVYLMVQPLYNDCTDHGCLDICTADIPGRHLASPVPAIFKAWGHLGIGRLNFTGNPNEPYHYDVLEVLNEEKMIQVNTLDDFRSREWYWGAKFKAPDMPIAPDGKKYPNLTESQAAAVFQAGADQMQFCQEYTLIPMLCHPGESETTHVYDAVKQQWITQLTETCAKFRSDIFVNYAFAESIYVTLPTQSRYGFRVRSDFTYDSMLSTRPALLAENVSISSQEENASTSEKISANLSSKDKLFEAITYYKQAKSDDIFEMLINAFSQLNEDASLSSEERTKILLEAIEKNKEDIELVKLLTDNFSSSQYDLNNHLDEIIKLFNYYQDPVIKSHLLRGLATTYKVYLAGKTDKKTIEQVKIIQALFIEQTKKPQKGIYATALNYLTSIFSIEEAKEVMKNRGVYDLSPAEKKSIERNQVLLALNLLQESEEKWQEYMSGFSKEQHGIFAKRISGLAALPNYLEKFDEKDKKTLKSYLLENWPSYFKNNEGAWAYGMRNWFIALANLSTDNPNEKSEIRLCYLLQHPQVIEIALYTLSYTFEYDENQLTTCYQDLLTKLNTAKDDPNTTYNDRYFIRISINLLEERKELLLRKLALEQEAS